MLMRLCLSQLNRKLQGFEVRLHIQRLHEQRQEDLRLARKQHYEWHRSMDHIRGRVDELLDASNRLKSDIRAMCVFNSAMISPKEIDVRVTHICSLVDVVEEQITIESARHGNGDAYPKENGNADISQSVP